MRYSKPPLSIDEQIDLLVRRGMDVPDRDETRHYLTHINYYRLRGYWLPLEQRADGGEHSFTPGTRFSDVISLYVFDRHLKLLLMDAIERVEISVRTQWAYQLSLRHDAHCYMNAAIFYQAERHARCMEDLRKEIERSHETFIDHYRKTYDDPPLPPIWAACEVMSIGQLSHWIANLKHRPDRQAVADTYELDEVVLCSFLHHLTHVRNLCAHHSRVWNRRLTFTMKIPKRPRELNAQFNPLADRNIHNTLVMLVYLLGRISPESQWRRHLVELMALHPQANAGNMGFPPNWQARSPWKGVP